MNANVVGVRVFVVFLIFASQIVCYRQLNSTNEDDASFDVRYIPKKGLSSVQLVRPNQLSANRVLKPFIEKNPRYKHYLSKEGYFKQQTGLPFHEFRQLTSIRWKKLKKPGLDPNKWQSYQHFMGNIIHTKTSCSDKIRNHAKQIDKHDGIEILTILEDHKEMAGHQVFSTVCILDSKTILLLPYRVTPVTKKIVVSVVKELQKIGKAAKEKPRWFEKYKKCAVFGYERSDYFITLPFSGWIPFFQKELNPLLKTKFAGAEEISLGLVAGAELKVLSEIRCKNSEHAEELKNRLEEILASYTRVAEKFSKSKNPDIQSIAKDSMRSLESVTVQRKLKFVELSGKIKLTKNSIQSLAGHYTTQVQDEMAHQKLRLGVNAIHLFYSDFNRLPAAVYTHKTGHKHSWRIMLLPYLGHQELFDKYRLDEPWDSDHNKKLTSKMPDVFRHPMDKDPNSLSPGYSVFTGEGTAFAGPENNKGNFGPSFRDFRDGTSNTILGAEIKRNVHWADPQVFSFEDFMNGKEVGGYSDGKIRVFLGDGSTKDIAEGSAPEVLKKLSTISGGDIFDGRDFQYQPPKLIDLDPRSKKN